MSVANLVGNLTPIALQVSEALGFEMVKLDVVGGGKKPSVQVFIDKEEGISVEDCSRFSHEFGNILDEKDLISKQYVLEVSSPGLERELFKLKDYARFAGNLAKIKTNEDLNGQKNFRGRIIGIEDQNVVFNDKAKGKVSIPFEWIAKANLEIDIEEEFKRAKALENEEKTKSV